MADNVPITAGSGTTISTEEVTTLNGGAVSAQHIQRLAAAIRTADGEAIDLPGDTANGLDVDVTRLPALPAGTNNIGDVDVLTLPALPAGTNNIGDVDVLTLPALPAGTNNIGDVDVLTVPAPLSTTGGGTEATALRVTVASDSTGVLSVDDNGGSLTVDAPLGTPLFVTPTPGTTGGWSIYYNGALSNTAQTAKAGTGTLGGWYVYNPNASAAYVQFFDAASPTVGTPLFAIGIPATSAANLEITNGLLFGSNSIKLAATTAPNNSTAPGTALVVTLWYK